MGDGGSSGVFLLKMVIPTESLQPEDLGIVTPALISRSGFCILAFIDKKGFILYLFLPAEIRFSFSNTFQALQRPKLISEDDRENLPNCTREYLVGRTCSLEKTHSKGTGRPEISH